MIFKKRTLIEINSKIAKEILKKKRLDKDYNDLQKRLLL